MRKWILFVFLLSLGLHQGLFAGKTIGVSLSYSPNMEFSQRIVEEVRFYGRNYSLYLVEHSGQRILIGASYDAVSNNWLSHEFMVDSSFTYGLCGWSGLGYLLRLSFSGDAAFLRLSLGVQLAVAYGPYFGKALFSLTPLCGAEAGVYFRDFEVLAYMSFSTPHGKEWKANPSVGGKAFVKVGDSHWLGGEVFVKFAEYLTGPRTMVSAFGISVLYELRMEGNDAAMRAEQ